MAAAPAYNGVVQAPTDEQLLKEYLAGQAASFELLVRRHAQELYQFAVRFTGNSVTAEDVVQETFLQVHNSAASFDPSRRFKPWLFTIAANKARDAIRRRTRRRELSFEAQVVPKDEAAKRFVELLSSDADEPEDDLLIEERRRIVRDAVQAMPPKLREVLVLAYYHRLPYRDIAEIVEVPLGTVKSRLHAAVATFRDCYQAAWKDRATDEP